MANYPRNGGVSICPSKVIILYEKQKGKCPYCGDSLYDLAVAEGNNLAMDHIIPLSKGGLSTFSNYAIACAWCNRRKKTHSAEDFREQMRPYREEVQSQQHEEGGGI